MIGSIQQPDATGTWCMIGDPTAVETRFGLRDCRPTDPGGNHCVHRVPAWGLDVGGRPRMAVLMVLADHILGELPYMRRPDRTWSLTSELTLEVIGQLPRVDTLVAEAVDTAQGDESFVQCRITDTAGALVAVGTARTAYVPATADDPVAEVSATYPEESAVLDIGAMIRTCG